MARCDTILKPLVAGLLALTSASCSSDSVTGLVCEPTTVDYSNQGTFQTESLSLGGLTVTGSADVNVQNLNGLGIVGGLADSDVDGTEFIGFSVDAGAAKDVSYIVSSAGNADGDGLVGEATIEAFDASATSLGVVAVNGAGTKNVSALFGDEPTTVDYSNQGTFQTPSLSLGGLTVTGSADVNVLNLNGLGIVGGLSDSDVDGTEFIGFSVDAGAAKDVSYIVSSAGDADGDGLVGEATIEAFDASATSLGVVAVNGAGTKNVSALFGDEPISAFVVTSDMDSFRIRSANFTPGEPIQISAFVVTADVDLFRVLSASYTPCE